MNSHHRLLRLVAITLEELRAQFVDRTPLGGKTNEPMFAPGAFYAADTYDYDGCAGQPVVNVVRIYPTAGRGGGPLDETATSVPCGTVWAAILQIGIVRCTSVMDERGNVGDPADIQNEALVLLDDAARLRAVWCNVIARADDEDISSAALVDAFEPEGPDGGLVGGRQPARFQLA